MQPDNSVPPVVPQSTQPVVDPIFQSVQTPVQPIPPQVPPVTTTLSPVVTGQVVYASFGRRLAATLVDSVALGIIGGIISIPFGIVTAALSSSNSPSLAGSLISAMSSLIIGLLEAGYFIYFIGAKGQTLGKMALKIKVVKEDTGEVPGFAKAFLREMVGKFLSSLVFGFGYFAPL